MRQVFSFTPLVQINQTIVIEHKAQNDENGWWNSVTRQDREEAARQIRQRLISSLLRMVCKVTISI